MTYDSREAIQQRISSIDEFEKLIKERKAAVKKTNVLLGKWVVSGQWMLTEFGDLGLLSKRSASPRTAQAVMTLAEYFERCREDVEYKASFSLPSSSDICECCGMGWAMESLHDYVALRQQDDSYKFFHGDCNKVRLLNQELKVFQESFKEAGFVKAVFRPIPNEYWLSTDDWATPWFIVETEIGTLKVGWRKRVCVIDWSKTGKNYLHLFTEENVTKDEKMIHAWGDKEILDYLKRIRNA